MIQSTKSAEIEPAVPVALRHGDLVNADRLCVRKEENPPNELINRGRGQRRWTAKQRAEASARIRKNQPWKHATGPKTAEGKAVSRYNAYRHGLKSALSLRLCRLLREQARFVRMANKTLAKPKVSAYNPAHQGLWEVAPDPKTIGEPHHRPRFKRCHIQDVILKPEGLKDLRPPGRRFLANAQNDRWEMVAI